MKHNLTHGDKMKNTFKYLTVAFLLAFGAVASATAITPPLVIDFAYAGNNGGYFSEDSGTGEVSGSLVIDLITLSGGNSLFTGSYDVTDGLLTFDTAGASSITVTGGVIDLGVAAGTELFAGAFVNWNYADGGPITTFSGSGAGIPSASFLNTIGEADANNLVFSGFTMQNEFTGEDTVTTTSTDFLAVETGGRITTVPIPATVWLLGSGLIGMVGIGRRRKI